jgi:glutamine synthetase
MTGSWVEGANGAKVFVTGGGPTSSTTGAWKEGSNGAKVFTPSGVDGPRGVYSPRTSLPPTAVAGGRITHGNYVPGGLPMPGASSPTVPAALPVSYSGAPIANKPSSPRKALAVIPDTGADMLSKAQTHIFDDRAMEAAVGAQVFQRFKDCLKTGAPTTPEDQKVIAQALYKWARKLGASSFGHWFFPLRGGGGVVGGGVSALKYDLFADLDWKSDAVIKPFEEAFPADRLFVGETDGSSFPNGGLRVTHAAAAFTTWDRGSPCFVHGTTLYIPCAFVTFLGTCIDEKTPLLRSMDAVNRHGLRLLKAMRKESKATSLYSYLGWEQEFFVVPAALYRARPDLVNCGRTLIGRLPTRNQQGELNYFAAPPRSVEKLMDNIQAIMLRVGNPMIVKHNEVAPGQHEMSPIFCVANASADSNALFMQVAAEEAEKLGLAVLFHEKPFKGINGSGKHCNWSVGTDTGANFFHPGKNNDSLELFVAAIACLAFGLKQHNEIVRCVVAHAGNDHRLGAQEAPPAIISLYPGAGFEAHVDAIIAGGPLTGYNSERKKANPGSRNTMTVPTGAEDRNRTAPFPHCGNRFEFRAVGSSQCCSMPVAICNTMFASGMAHLASMLEGGMSLRDAVAIMYRDNREVIFTGNGYSKEWPAEAARRGLPNLNTTPLAARTFNSYKSKAVFKDMGIFEPDEVDARAELMFEAYNTTLQIEVNTLVKMIDSQILPACAKDLSIYKDAPFLVGERVDLYNAIKQENDRLKDMAGAHHHEAEAEAFYFCDTIKPQMEVVRALVDKAEDLMQAEFYPFPTYEALCYSHHT